ncbi:protein neprosin-like [Lycium barbarum]|uniref:protein neprosin-like n=1 Tax=Lycium barbarum TaxID=112863 RepID=UPI00293EC749|nr:protein neprosin-like [Lycium barbarum]
MNEFRMHQRIVQQILLVLYLILSCNGLQGEKKLSKLENMELEKQLKLLNKPAIKTIKSNNNSEQKGRYISSRGYKLAIAQTPNDPNNKFAGAGMATSLYNPLVEGKQHSACRLKIQKVSDILQVGWRVDPTLYGDNKIRLFIHFQAGKIHCFNTLCLGFVQVNTEIPLDMSYENHISQREVKTWEETMYIERDLVDGNWWLLMEDNYERVGFWPQRIFTDLASFATNVEWGGIVYSPPGVPEPPMGSSFFPSKYPAYDGYCKSIAVLNDKGGTVEVNKVHTHVDSFNVYKVLFERLPEGSKSFNYVLYGGPGGSIPV